MTYCIRPGKTAPCELVKGEIVIFEGTYNACMQHWASLITTTARLTYAEMQNVIGKNYKMTHAETRYWELMRKRNRTGPETVEMRQLQIALNSDYGKLIPHQ